MASTDYLMAYMALLLLLLPLISAMEYDYPGPPPDNICDEVNCGKGTCKASVDYKFNYICECDSDWRRTRFYNEDDHKYLPCVIPKCTLKYSCMRAPPPAPANPQDELVSDRNHACYWMYCGEGTCTSDTYNHKCECNYGYRNLLNDPVYPCYGECALGCDCGRLGIKVSNSCNGSTGASSFLPDKTHWMTLALISMGLLLWK